MASRSSWPLPSVRSVPHTRSSPGPTDSHNSTVCAGVTTWSALKRTNAKPGDWLAISGAAGGLGHLAVQYALAIGLRVVAIDGGDDKRKLCEGYGVDHFVDFRDYKSGAELIEAVKAICDGIGPHVRFGRDVLRLR